jgi:hypothetical protein
LEKPLAAIFSHVLTFTDHAHELNAAMMRLDEWKD